MAQLQSEATKDMLKEFVEVLMKFNNTVNCADLALNGELTRIGEIRTSKYLSIHLENVYLRLEDDLKEIEKRLMKDVESTMITESLDVEKFKERFQQQIKNLKNGQKLKDFNLKYSGFISSIHPFDPIKVNESQIMPIRISDYHEMILKNKEKIVKMETQIETLQQELTMINSLEARLKKFDIIEAELKTYQSHQEACNMSTDCGLLFGVCPPKLLSKDSNNSIKTAPQSSERAQVSETPPELKSIEKHVQIEIPHELKFMEPNTPGWSQTPQGHQMVGIPVLKETLQPSSILCQDGLPIKRNDQFIIVGHDDEIMTATMFDDVSIYCWKTQTTRIIRHPMRNNRFINAFYNKFHKLYFVIDNLRNECSVFNNLKSRIEIRRLPIGQGFFVNNPCLSPFSEYEELLMITDRNLRSCRIFTNVEKGDFKSFEIVPLPKTEVFWYMNFLKRDISVGVTISNKIFIIKKSGKILRTQQIDMNHSDSNKAILSKDRKYIVVSEGERGKIFLFYITPNKKKTFSLMLTDFMDFPPAVYDINFLEGCDNTSLMLLVSGNYSKGIASYEISDSKFKERVGMISLGDSTVYSFAVGELAIYITTTYFPSKIVRLPIK